MIRSFQGLTLLPGPERRCQQPGVQTPKCPCGSPCSHCAGLHLSGWQGERGEGHMMNDGGNRTKVCIYYDQKAQLIPFPTSSLNHKRMFAICWYFRSLFSLCNLSIILAPRCLFWGWNTPTMNIFSSETPKQTAVCKKEITVNHAGPLIIRSIVFGPAYLEILPHSKFPLAFILTFGCLFSRMKPSWS